MAVGEVFVYVCEHGQAYVFIDLNNGRVYITLFIITRYFSHGPDNRVISDFPYISIFK